MTEEILRVDKLKKYFPVTGFLGRTVAFIKAVDGVSFFIRKGETFGLAGESGSGKSTLGRCILRLIEPTEGQIYFMGENILKLKKNEIRQIRRDMQIVFQDPLGSCDPRMTIGDIIAEPLEVHRMSKKEKNRQQILELMENVGLEPELYNKYPHEVSGGQVQRVGIARALALNPKFIVADEPVSALDASIQAQILNLLLDLQKDRGLTYLFIAHDLSVIRYVSHRVGIMYLGKMVEVASVDRLFSDFKHPYTEVLISAILTATSDSKGKKILIKGEVPSPLSPPMGCRFQTRCHKKIGKICEEKEPQFLEIERGHYVACHLWKK